MIYTDWETTDIKLSCLGLGGEQLGGHGWGKVSDKQMIDVVHKALDLGITLFDTAPIYGLGHSEEVLGKALGINRKNVIIATKAGLRWRTGKHFEKSIDSSPSNIEREIDLSLKRLRTDYIDLYQIHWHDPDTPLEETLVAMSKLKQAGKIRCIGCCNFTIEVLREAMKYEVIETAQIPYNLIDRTSENDILPFCRDKNIKVLTYSPLARGFLSGKYDADTVFSPNDNRNRTNDKYFSGEEIANNLVVLERLKLISNKIGETPSQIAIRWCLDNRDITSVIFGAKNALQVEENVASLDFSILGYDIEFLSKEIE